MKTKKGDGYCHDCQLKRGAVEPKHGLEGVTCTLGTCSGCGEKGSSLVPDCDYDWPKEGRKAVWD